MAAVRAGLMGLVVLAVAAPPPASACLVAVGELPDGPARSVDADGDLAVLGRGRVLAVADLSVSGGGSELGTVVLPGLVEAVDLVGDRVWVAAGRAGLAVVDVTDPTRPEVVFCEGASGVLRDATAVDVRYDGQIAYLVESGSVSRLRLFGDDGGSIRELGALDQPGSLTALDVVAGHVVLANSNQGLRVVDVTDPSSPAVVGRHGEIGGARDVAVSDGKAYLVGTSSLRVFDISDPADPSVVTRVPAVIGAAIEVAGGLVYVSGPADPYRPGEPGLRIFDLSQPDDPQEVAFFGTALRVPDVVVGSGRALLAAGADGVRVVDVSDPAVPVEVGALPARTTAFRIAADGGLALVGDRESLATGRPAEVAVIDLSDPAAPAVLGTLPIPDPPPHWTAAVAIDGSTAFAADLAADRVTIFDVTGPTHPVVSASVEVWNPEALVATDPFLYVLGEHDVTMVDVSDPWSPDIGGLAPSSVYAEHLAAGGNRVAVGYGMSPFGGFPVGIDVFDVGSSDGLVLLGSTEPWYGSGLALEGSTLMTSGRLGPDVAGLVTFDLSDADGPSRVASVEIAGSTAAIASEGRLATVLGRSEGGLRGVYVVDVGDPRHPRVNDVHHLPGAARDVAMTGGLVVVADGEAGVVVLDASACPAYAPRRPGGRVAD